mmetsp:Transcript_17014/g.39264  ORF Transcript_17014/g.39264 Transcript_17014/m.39264 type:complete len:284 (+) Transcript_17014:79-930(+)
MQEQRQAQLDRQRQRMNQQQQDNEPTTGGSSAAPQGPKGMERSYLLFSNVTLMVAWARVLRVIYRAGIFGRITTAVFEQQQLFPTLTNATCSRDVTPALNLALALSFMEVFNAAAGLTRSKVPLVMLFCSVRAVTEAVVAPRLAHCGASSHTFTVTVWSLGETIRFGCFVLDLLVPGGRLAKTIRYTAGPLLFPLGALGEVWMVATYAQQEQQWWWLVAAAILWPMGIYPLMTQLLRQRNKFLARDTAEAATTTTTTTNEINKSQNKYHHHHQPGGIGVGGGG